MAEPACIQASAGKGSEADLYLSAGDTLTNFGNLRTIANGSGAEAYGTAIAETLINKSATPLGAFATSGAEAYFDISASVISNSGGTIQASAGPNAFAEVYIGGLGGTVYNKGGTILATATGNGSAFVNFNSDTVIGGTLQTIGSAAIGVDDYGSAAILSATFAANSKILAVDGGQLFLGNDTINSGSTAEALNGGRLLISGGTRASPFTLLAVTSDTSYTETSAGLENAASANVSLYEALVTSSYFGFAETFYDATGSAVNRGTIEALVTSSYYGSAFAFLSGGSGATNSKTIEAITSDTYGGSTFAFVLEARKRPQYLRRGHSGHHQQQLPRIEPRISSKASTPPMRPVRSSRLWTTTAPKGQPGPRCSHSGLAAAPSTPARCRR